MTTPRVGVLALQGDVREHVAALRAVGAEPVMVRRQHELDDVDGLVLPGGESTTIGRLLEVFDLLEPLRKAVQGGLPVYGSCAGMVLLAAEVVGGQVPSSGLAGAVAPSSPNQATVGGLDITVRRNAFGSQVDSFEADLDLTGIADGPVHGVFIRAPWVERAGDDVEVLGRVEDPHAGHRAAGRVVAVRQNSLLATSFHPELTGDPRVHGLFVEMVKEARP